MISSKRSKGKMDKLLILFTLLISIISVLFMYSATYEKSVSGLSPYVIKQTVWVLVGFVFLLLIANTDYSALINTSYILYILNLLALVFLLLLGGERYGARRWITLGPISIQPSEFMKITIIMVLAGFLSWRKDRIGTLSNFLLSGILILPAALLIFLQPDLGTAFVLLPILFSILYVTGEKVKYILFTIIGGLLCMPLGWSLLRDYQKNRLMVFMNPDLDPLGAGYTIIQSKIAIGSGGLFGKGWLNGTQSYLKFLPERHTDFIFSVIGEEIGFIGSCFIIGIYVLIISRGIIILSKTHDVMDKAIVTGILTLMAFQVFVNISMTIGLMPVVGLPLPIITYGGSNTVTSFMCIGFLLSISKKLN